MATQSLVYVSQLYLLVKDREPRPGETLKAWQRRIEKLLIEQALKICYGNKTLASEFLGINRTTLVEKMKAHRMRVNPPCRGK